MAKDALFRNSLGGYNKDDVNRYIEELAVQYADRGNELEGEIKELKKELEVLPSLVAEKEKAERLSAENEVLKKENADISEAIKAQGEELEEKKALLLSVTAEKDALEIRVRELSERDEKLTAENARITAQSELKEKELQHSIEEYEALKASLDEEKDEFERRAGEMLVQIENEARAVIAKANETANRIVDDAKKRADAVKPDSPVRHSEPSSYHAKKKDNFSDMLEGHKSKMDSFFAAITKTLRGDSK